jgi:DNA invertase Pin-like site-specific DNA recombinase
LLADYTEVESGRKASRPRLSAALQACRRQRAVLLIAKLDRLARSVHFISGLMESGVEFVAVDNPHANRLMLHLLAAFAEHEREQISIRTKAALAAARARGVRLGIAAEQLAQRHKTEADRFADALFPLISEYQGQGVATYSGLARQLNKDGIATPSGGVWHAQTVKRLIARMTQGTTGNN